MHKTPWTTVIRMTTAMAVGLAALAALVSVSAAESAPNNLWLLSTRQAPWSNPVGGEDRLRCWRLEGADQWVAADLEALLAADDPAVPTCIFIHGNRSDRQSAVRMGWSVYRQVEREAGERPFRFVIWSWPADQIRGLRQDVQVKAHRSDVQAYYLARYLGRANPDVPVCLIGYSFGARTITGALHLMAGGRLAGWSLPEGTAPAQRTPVRAVLVAAAIDNGWLLPGWPNGLALGQAERMLVTRNLCDPVLKWYRLMYRAGGPEALGYTGPAAPARLGEEREKIETLVLDCSVGGNHDCNVYLSAPALRSRLAWYAFLEPSEPAAGAPQSQARIEGLVLPEEAVAAGD